MEHNFNQGGGQPQPQLQPNGILPRPQSQSRRVPPVQPVVQPHQAQVVPQGMYGESEDDDEFEVRPPPRRPVVAAAAGSGDASSSNPNANAASSDQGRMRNNRESKPVSRVPSKEPKDVPKYLKIAVVGDSTVGKSCILNSVTSESYTFNKNYQLTCGVIVHAKSVKLPSEDGMGDGTDFEERLNMALLDSSGQDLYLEYLPKYWEKLDGFVLMIDLTSPSSLANAENWIKLALDSCPQKDQALGVLIGNKMDLIERRKISPQAAQEFATKHNLQYFECSVKDNSGLEEPFFYLAHKWKTTRGHEDNKENRR